MYDTLPSPKKMKPILFAPPTALGRCGGRPVKRYILNGNLFPFSSI